MNGLLLIDKPSGMTSQAVVSRIRRLCGVKRVGHSGTLDPMATGLLPVLVGNACPASDFLLNGDKTYEAVIQMGMTTDTEDITGTVLTSGELPDGEAVLQTAASFIGEILQIPPMYSAIKQNGQPLYKLARQGEETERQARLVRVYEALPLWQKPEQGLYAFSFTVSKGTYIRTLAADIGKQLGCGACLASLRRIAHGGLQVEQAVSLAQVEEQGAEAYLQSVETALGHLPVLNLASFYARLIRNGCAVEGKKLGLNGQENGAVFRLYACGRFFAIGQLENEALRMIRFFEEPELGERA